MMEFEGGNTESPSSDTGFDEGWLDDTGVFNSHGMSAITDFNAAFGADSAESTLDPRLALSNQPVADNQYYETYNNIIGLDFATFPGTSPYQPHGQSTVQQASDLAGFESIESGAAPSIDLLPQNNILRRSVSEPPGAPAMQHYPAPPVTFHRENHYLGRPMQQKSMPLKSLPKNKESRHHPYRRQLEQRRDDDQNSRHFSQEHPRVQMSSFQAGPTSAPIHQIPIQYVAQPRPRNLQMLDSRGRRPDLQPVVGLSLLAEQNTSTTRMSSSQIPSGMLSLSMTVDELRAMILEAVQEAMGITKPAVNEAAAGEAVDPKEAEEGILKP